MTTAAERKAASEAPPVTPAPAISTEPLLPVLRGYITFRREQLRKMVGPPNINRGAASAIVAQAREHVLGELEALADWLEKGRPEPATILTEDDKDFWRAAQRRGIVVPSDIKEQL